MPRGKKPTHKFVPGWDGPGARSCKADDPELPEEKVFQIENEPRAQRLRFDLASGRGRESNKAPPARSLPEKYKAFSLRRTFGTRPSDCIRGSRFLTRPIRIRFGR